MNRSKPTNSLVGRTIGRYFSISSEDDKTGKVSWEIYGYEIAEGGELKVYGHNADAIADGVARRELAGRVESRRIAGFFFGSYVHRDVEISDSPERIRRFLKQHGRNCWLTDKKYVVMFVKQ